MLAVNWGCCGTQYNVFNLPDYCYELTNWCAVADALRLYSSHLSSYEIEEIHNYPEIWFLGLEAEKVNATTGAPLNNGFDDQHGSYTKVC